MSSSLCYINSFINIFCSSFMCECYRPSIPPNSYVEVLTLSVVGCGDDASKEVIKVKWSVKMGL